MPSPMPSDRTRVTGPLVVISCGAAKQAGRHPAHALYTGSYFKASSAWARSVTTTDRIYILSALYGLVPHDQEIDSYNVVMGDPGSVTLAHVLAQADTLGLANEASVYVVGGERYVRIARNVWPRARAPFGKDGGMLKHGKAGIGYQIQALKRWNGRLP